MNEDMYPTDDEVETLHIDRLRLGLRLSEQEDSEALALIGVEQAAQLHRIAEALEAIHGGITWLCAHGLGDRPVD